MSTRFRPRALLPAEIGRVFHNPAHSDYLPWLFFFFRKKGIYIIPMGWMCVYLISYCATRMMASAANRRKGGHSFIPLLPGPIHTRLLHWRGKCVHKNRLARVRNIERLASSLPVPPPPSPFNGPNRIRLMKCNTRRSYRYRWASTTRQTPRYGCVICGAALAH